MGTVPVYVKSYAANVAMIRGWFISLYGGPPHNLKAPTRDEANDFLSTLQRTQDAHVDNLERLVSRLALVLKQVEPADAEIANAALDYLEREGTPPKTLRAPKLPSVVKVTATKQSVKSKRREWA